MTTGAGEAIGRSGVTRGSESSVLGRVFLWYCANMMQRKGETGDAGSRQRMAGSTPEERLIEGKMRAAKRALIAEKLWPRVWLPLFIAGVFVLLSAFEVWQLLPPRLHFYLLCAFGVALALSFLPLVLWRRPSRETLLARIEQASALPHRPLTAFNDTLSQENPSPETLALWEAHRARAAEALKKLKAGAPHPRIDKYDPFALRAALVLMLLAAGSFAWDDLGRRVRGAFEVPELPAGAGFRIDAWISPPPYTRKEPFVLPDSTLQAGKDAVAVPEGSVLTVKVNGPDAAGYRVALEEAGRTQVLDPAGQSNGTYAEYTQKIERSARLSIHRSFGPERSWLLTAVPDLPPKIVFAGPVEVSPRGVMLFKYKVDDDYGVMSAEARIERIVPQPGNGGGATEELPQIGKPPIFPLSLPKPPVRSAEGKTYRDLTSHPWAGLPVVITLVAKDEAGHEGMSAARGMILPERKFTKPLAKAIAGQRRSLVELPGDALRIASNLNAIAIAAADEGIASEIYLNLRSAYWRLGGRHSAEDIESVAGQLWDAAIRIEDGNLSSAERELRAAQERLKDAIESGAPPEEIQRLMAELRQALGRYLQALAQQRSSKSGQAALSPDAKTVSPQDLERMLSKIESLAKAGSAEAAAQMLNELRDILESVQAGSQSGSASDRENAERMRQLDQLTDIVRKQQQLLDRTFRAQQGSDGGQGAAGERGTGGGEEQQEARGQAQSGTGALKDRQEEVQSQLQDLLSGMAPDKEGNAVQRKLKEADGAMGEAAGALDQNDLGEATDQQGRALEALRQGTRSIAEQMMRSAGRGNGQAGRDPLGRRQDNQLSDPGDSVKIPDEITVQRARQILDELRKRLGEPQRPALELDYLERLIKPY
ncbi:MAG: TIGR02302 family protein [Rhodomicrobium sp.]